MSATEWIGFAALIVMVAVLTGCAREISGEEIQWASQACAEKGGLMSIEHNAARHWSAVAAQCKNLEVVLKRFDRFNQ